MKFIPTEIPDVLIVEPDVHRDARGFFMESFNLKKYQEAGIRASFVQDNHSRSVRNTLRGLHFQWQHAQGKLVRAVQGEIVDVAVDIRRGSPTFKKWISVTLSADNFRQIWVPPGLAHGVFVVSETAEVEYKCTDFYNPAFETSLLWNDPEIGIRWPNDHPLLSVKDQAGLLLKDLGEKLPLYRSLQL